MPPYRMSRVLPNAQRIARRGISLPSATSLTLDDQAYVIDCVRDIAAGIGHARRSKALPVTEREHLEIDRAPMQEAA